MTVDPNSKAYKFGRYVLAPIVVTAILLAALGALLLSGSLVALGLRAITGAL